MRVDADDKIRIADALADLGYGERGFRSGGLFIRLRDGNVGARNLHLYRPDDPNCHD